MDHNTAYTYNYQPRQRSPVSTSSRTTGAYQNSSAFSASANADEDWTKISDLAERRRIQNRIAQRNYRKKLKRRLEDLERRTTSSSASPEQSHRELVKTPVNDANTASNQSMSRRRSVPRASMLPQEQQYSLDLLSSEDAWTSQMSNNKLAFSASAPSSYALPDSYNAQAEYPTEDFNSAAYARMSMMYATPTYSPSYIQPVTAAHPPMVPSDAFKAEQRFSGGGEMMTPFNMNYASLAGYEVPSTNNASDFTSRTPPLTSSSLYFDTNDCSPPQFALPITPESRSASPNIALFDRIEV